MKSGNKRKRFSLKIIAITTILVLVAIIVALSVFRDKVNITKLQGAVINENDEIKAINVSNTSSGSCTWYITNNVLYIKPTSGTEGTLQNITAQNSAPWSEYAESITGVSITATVKTSTGAVGLFQRHEKFN